MNRIMSLICFAVFAFSCTTYTVSISDDGSLSIEVNKEKRTYELHVPASLQEDAPLLFVLHGYNGTNTEIMSALRMNDFADTYGFIVCYPQGINDKSGYTHWNDGLAPSDVDDVNFLSELAIKLQHQYSVDPEKVWTTGFSNGAFMSFKLICQRPDIFKAAAPVGGIMSHESWDNRPSSGNAIPVLQIHGMSDPVVAHDASKGPFGGTYGLGPGLDTVMQYWADYNNCVRSEEVSLSNAATLRSFYTEEGDSPVQYIMIEKHGHTWPYDPWDGSGIDASELIVDFFRGL